MTDTSDRAVSVPASADLLRAFANTLDVDVDADPQEAFPNPRALTDWLREKRLIQGDSQADTSDLDLAVTLRSGLRTAMLHHHERGDASSITELGAAAAALPLQVRFDGADPRLVPALEGVRGALAWLLVAVAESKAEGTWARLKLCPADDCLLAFYDASKNRSRHWCSMNDCGNRQKTRNYRARQRRP